jgi:hypothetical protein
LSTGDEDEDQDGDLEDADGELDEAELEDDEEHFQHIMNQERQFFREQEMAGRRHVKQHQASNLTDHLVYYPSSATIQDYNSSHNLDYAGQHMVQHPNMPPNMQQYGQPYHMAYRVIAQPQPSTSQHHQQHQQHHHKYLNKLSSWIPDNIKKKKMLSKRNRSNSLPVNPDGSSADEHHHQHPHHKKHMHIPNANYMKKKKKQIVSAVSNIMHKTKIYRRHSFTHRSTEDLNETISHTMNSPPSNYNNYQANIPMAADNKKLKYSLSDTEAQNYTTSENEGECEGDENDIDEIIKSAKNELEAPQNEPLFATIGDIQHKPDVVRNLLLFCNSRIQSLPKNVLRDVINCSYQKGSCTKCQLYCGLPIFRGFIAHFRIRP